MKETKEKEFLYNDMSERYKVINKIYFIGMTALYLMFGAYLLMRFFVGDINKTFAMANLVTVVLFMLINVIIYVRNKANAKMGQISVVLGGIELFIVGMFTDAEFVFYAVIVMLALQIPYFKSKQLGKMCLVAAVAFVAIHLYRYNQGIGVETVDSMCCALCVMLGLYVDFRMANIAQKFNEHALGSVEQQTQKVQKMFDGIVDVSKVVQEESEKSTDMVEILFDSTKQVTANMNEIVESTTTTAKNIEEQNQMTQNIQTAITQTSERSKRMVEIATNSNQSIRTNMKVMEELKLQSEQLAETNVQVNASMDRLQKKTKEVEAIAEMILGISSQTNLLALNASIERSRRPSGLRKTT